jgi:hypothetical protein
VGWVTLLVSTPALAADWAVEVDCVELGIEARSELEVRHLVELRSLPGEPGTLLIRCSEGSVEGAWQRDGVTLSSRAVTRAAGDDLLEVGHWLASMLIGTVEEQGGLPAAPSDQPTAVEPEPGPRSPAPVGKAEPTAEAAPAPEHPIERARAIAVAPARAPLRPAWTVGVAVSYHLFGSEVPGSIGPSLDGTLTLADRFGLHGAVGYEWSQGSAAGFSTREAWLGLHADFAVLPWLSFEVGPALSILTVTGSTAATSGEQTSTTVGVEVALRGVLPWPGIGGFGSLGLRSLARSREIRVEDQAVLTVPGWQASFLLGVQFGGGGKK